MARVAADGSDERQHLPRFSSESFRPFSQQWSCAEML